MVQMLNPGSAKTFLDYAMHVFCLICIRITPLALALFGIYIKQIGLRVQPDENGQRCAETSCSLCIGSK